jgi:outer membrane murein-binding lipoprotein Lpp
MLTAVWVAVIVAVVFWAAGVSVAVYLMMKAARLMTRTSAAVSGLAGRQDQLIDRANATIDRAGEQLAATSAITASMDEVTANMADLTGRVASLAPLARVISGTPGSAMAKTLALGYGVTRALWLRLPLAPAPARGQAAATGGTRARLLPRTPAPRRQPVPRRQPALTTRRDQVGP